MGREENIQVFEDTKKKCQSDARLRQAIAQANAAQRLILEKDEVTWKPAQRYLHPAKISVSRKRTLEAASAYIGKKVCVLNFASATNPGGGVTRGSSAQEEAICRCSSLYFNLTEKRIWEGFYAPHRAQKNASGLACAFLRRRRRRNTKISHAALRIADFYKYRGGNTHAQRACLL